MPCQSRRSDGLRALRVPTRACSARSYTTPWQTFFETKRLTPMPGGVSDASAAFGAPLGGGPGGGRPRRAVPGAVAGVLRGEAFDADAGVGERRERRLRVAVEVVARAG